MRKSLLVGLLTGAAPGALHAQAAAVPSASTVPPSQLQTPAPGATTAAPQPTTSAQSSQGTPSPQAAAPSPDEEDDSDDAVIVVTGRKPPGEVPGNIAPEVQLDSRDIRSYGASSLTELLADLAPQTESGRGRGGGQPVILLNGRRISSFSEIRDLPPEALIRVDILPEEAALKLGYRADQRVVNFVLRPRFRSLTDEVKGGFATDGGRGNFSWDSSLVRINNGERLTIDGKYQHQSALFEDQRNITQASGFPYALGGNIAAANFGEEIDPALSALLGEPVAQAGISPTLSGTPTLGDFTAAPNSTDVRPFRTLAPQTDDASINATLSRPLSGNTTGTLNFSYEQNNSSSQSGLASGSFLVPASNPFSPFASDVVVYRYFTGPHPLARDVNTGTGHAGLTVDGDVGRWRWSLTANYDHVLTTTDADRSPSLTAIQDAITAGDPTLDPFAPLPLATLGQDRARALAQTGNGQLVASGPLFSLPAGDVATSVKVGVEAEGYDTRSLRAGVAERHSLSRRDANGQINLDLPIASRTRGVLSAIGDLSANVNFAADQVSDFGTLTTLGYGLNWSPIGPVTIIASVTDEHSAPSVQQLGDPVLLIPNVRVFDFVRGETADVAEITGGNPNLGADHRRVFKLGVTIKPIRNQNLTITANYIRTRIRDQIASFPTATPEIEAAFPDRFDRDDEGRLVSIDTRPVNFARADTAQIRWGVTFFKPIASRNPAAAWRAAGGRGFGGFGGPGGPGGGRGRGDARGGPGADGQGRSNPAPAAGQGAPPVPPGGQDITTPPAPGGPATAGGDAAGAAQGGGRGEWWRRNGGNFGRGGSRQSGRLQLSLFHTWYLKDQVLIRPGVPLLDFLNGSAAGNSGGQPRHKIEAQAGIFKNGFGARLSANWQSATVVHGSPGVGGGPPGNLHFSDLSTMNFRLFANLGEQPSLIRKHRWLAGTRLSLAVDNIFNARLHVRDATGAIPLSYQPDYLDPVGRTVSISLRKLFF